MTAAATNTSKNFDRHFRDQFEPDDCDDDCDCDSRADDILVDFPERRCRRRSSGNDDGDGDATEIATEIATPPTRDAAKTSKWKTSSHDDEKLRLLLNHNHNHNHNHSSSSSFHNHSTTNFGNLADLTDSFVSHVGESLGGLGLAERGWNSVSTGLVGALSGAVSFPKPRDEHAGSRAFEANGASNLAPAAARRRRRSSRMSATPAQIAAAVNWIREEEEDKEGAASARSSRGSLFNSLEDIERYARRNSVARGGSENGRGGDDGHDAFDELREWMGDDAFLMDISERDEDEEDVDTVPGVVVSRDGTDGKKDDLHVARGIGSSKLQLRSATGSSIDDTGRNQHAPTTVLGESNRKPKNKRKSVISLSPMCRISTALKEMFGDEVGPRCS